MTPNDRAVLVALSERYDWDCDYYTFQALQRETGLPRRDVRLSARRLARKGLAQYGRGLWDDCGEPAGAGYRCTKAGFELLTDGAKPHATRPDDANGPNKPNGETQL